MPPALVASPHVESSYNPNARSHLGASGIWQFTRGTGHRYLEVDHVLDERNDPWVATTAVTGSASRQTELLSDPSDYSVAADHTIEVQPIETLGHYADWLGLRAQRLRELNGLAFRTPVTVGQRLRLDFSKVDPASFEARRIAWQRSEQDAFFRDNVITGVIAHTVRPGESVWILTLRRYGVPVWLFRQYNPGVEIRFPVLAAPCPRTAHKR